MLNGIVLYRYTPWHEGTGVSNKYICLKQRFLKVLDINTKI